ncbi:MAG: site-specific integrase [Limimaricola soesokkakensis]|uniref:site-specific integrase n=1 Tax=Limimaricola soesokkakensis TaxID=1343159 RepID=UPI0040594ACC
MNKSPHFTYFLHRFTGSDNRPRGALINTDTKRPSLAIGIYDAALAISCASPNTHYVSLTGVRPLFSWAQSSGINLDARLLRGEYLTHQEIRGFSMWLHRAFLNGREGPTFPPDRISTFNAYLGAAQRMITWFVTQYCQVEINELPRNVIVENIVSSASRVWREQRKKQHLQGVAADLQDDEIVEIETFLRHAASGKNPESRWLRTYLIWRLTIEHGFRIGEILALRLEDCPNRFSRAFHIIRIEDRIGGPPDPRGNKSPRPKTLGRELESIISNSAFPKLVNDYITSHRVVRKGTPSGAMSRRPVLHHNYLVVNDRGEPLSMRTATSLAATIRRETGVPFTWHLARHAFFNRAYEAVARIEDPTQKEIRTNDLVHWGGWSDHKSLDLYVRRIRRQRARTALSVWGETHASWEALG